MSNTNWPFYFSLEADVINLSRYIEFDRKNFGVYSIELLRILLSTCSEIDVVLKQICAQLDENSKANNIAQYQKLICKDIDGFEEQHVVCSRFNLSFQPWNSWVDKKSPEWWRSYNEVKHNRDEHYSKASLQNVLESLSALYLVNMYNVFLKLNSTSPGFYFTVGNAVPHAPIQQDLFRLNDIMAYMME
ncbi:hypothetical protein OE749_04140 [Aestuariibacter sp. AA17]|uniref:Autophagy-related protein 101 n=1 Tax=Fluctibacter corallii TaxID=2984329 RepID=A0ABT3A5F9_9ALTE|nr:hypothetical protein [Aestuariibacter sp. AA17]MCV2883879.1 hypothetical protein [Aestuariibacter sp. AA17]